MIPVVAIPVIHSSGAWIASAASGGYVSGTLSSSWIGSFVLGNSGLVGALGFTGLASTSAIFGGGAIATALGLAPPTFLGLTTLGWATGGAGFVVATTTYLLYKKAQVRNALVKALPEINSERAKHGDYPYSYDELIDELKKAEEQARAESFELANIILIDFANDRSNLSVRPASDSLIDKEKFLVDWHAAVKKAGEGGELELGNFPFVETFYDNEWHEVQIGSVRYVLDQDGERIVKEGFFGDQTVLMIRTIDQIAFEEATNKASNILIDRANDPDDHLVRNVDEGLIDKEKVLADWQRALEDADEDGNIDFENYECAIVKTYCDNHWHEVPIGTARYVSDEKGERIITIDTDEDGSEVETVVLRLFGNLHEAAAKPVTPAPSAPAPVRPAATWPFPTASRK